MNYEKYKDANGVVKIAFDDIAVPTNRDGDTQYLESPQYHIYPVAGKWILESINVNKHKATYSSYEQCLYVLDRVHNAMLQRLGGVMAIPQ